MERYIADDKVLINLQGLRYAIKEDSTMGTYSLVLNYKGSECRVRYPDVASRDAIYDRICTMLSVFRVVP